MVTKWNFLSKSDFEIISQGCSLNMALVNGGILHYMDIKKFLENLLLWNRLSDFEIISEECSLADPFQKLFVKFWSINKRGSGE